jgi:hypothetical protein
VRTGVTIVHPRGRSNPDPVFGAWFTLNGNGEITGTTWLQESGILEGPSGITNTHRVGVVRDSILEWQATTIVPRRSVPRPPGDEAELRPGVSGGRPRAEFSGRGRLGTAAGSADRRCGILGAGPPLRV